MFAAEGLSEDLLLTLSIFGAVLFSILAVVSWLHERRAKPMERLERFARPGKALDERQNDWLRDRIDQLVAKAAPALTRPLMPQDDEQLGAVRQKLSSAGFRGEMAVSLFFAAKIVCALVLGTILAAAGGGLPLVGKYPWLMRAVIGGGLGMFVPDLVVGYISKKRQEQIFCGLPDALDLLVVCVESGLGLDAALKRVADELHRACPILARELELCVMQLQMGKPRTEVLRDLGRRNGVEDLRALAATLIQADRFGTSVGQALRVHSDAMRTRRRQLAEERAQKTTVKLLIPLILFIFPGIFVVLVGPAAIMIMRNLMN